MASHMWFCLGAIPPPEPCLSLQKLIIPELFLQPTVQLENSWCHHHLALQLLGAPLLRVVSSGSSCDPLLLDLVGTETKNT